MTDFCFTTDVQVSGVTLDAAPRPQEYAPPQESRPVGWCCDTAHCRNFFDTEGEAEAYAKKWLANGTWVMAKVFPVYRHPPHMPRMG